MRMITCEKAVGMVLELLEGALSPAARRALDEHLQRCPPCERLVATYKKTTELCRGAIVKQASPEFGERLLSFLRKQALHSDGDSR